MYRIIVILCVHGFLNTLFNTLKGRIANGFIRRLLKIWMKEEVISQHFTPKYDLGEQRLCASKGFIEAIPGIDVHTGTVEKVVNDGLIIDGKMVPADTIICATGFNLNYFKFQVKIDGVSINMYNQTIRHDFLFEAVPNLCNLIAFSRLAVQNASCFTPLVERNLQQMCSLVAYMKQKGFKRAVVRPTNAKKARNYPMTSSYFIRNQDKCFLSVEKEARNAGSVSNILFGYRFNPTSYDFS